MAPIPWVLKIIWGLVLRYPVTAYVPIWHLVALDNMGHLNYNGEGRWDTPTVRTRKMDAEGRGEILLPVGHPEVHDLGERVQTGRKPGTTTMPRMCPRLESPWGMPILTPSSTGGAVVQNVLTWSQPPMFGAATIPITDDSLEHGSQESSGDVEVSACLSSDEWTLSGSVRVDAGYDVSRRHQALTDSLERQQPLGPERVMHDHTSPSGTTRACEVEQTHRLSPESPRRWTAPGFVPSLDAPNIDEEDGVDNLGWESSMGSLTGDTPAFQEDRASPTPLRDDPTRRSSHEYSASTRRRGKERHFPVREGASNDLDSAASSLVELEPPGEVRKSQVGDLIGEDGRVLSPEGDVYPPETAPEDELLYETEDIMIPMAVDPAKGGRDSGARGKPGVRAEAKRKWLWNMVALFLIVSGVLTLSYVEAGNVPRWIVFLVGESRDGLQNRSPGGSFVDTAVPPSDSEADYRHLPELVRLHESSRFPTDTDSEEDETNSRDSDLEEDPDQSLMWDTRQPAPERLIFHPVYGIVPEGSARVWDQEATADGTNEEIEEEATPVVSRDLSDSTHD